MSTPANETVKNKVTTWNLISIFAKIYWKGIFLIIYPILLLPIVFYNNERMFRCLYVFAVMAGLWMTEALPINVTALFPLAIFPLMGILNTTETTNCYVNDTIMMFIGSLFIAIAIEYCGLHNRVALWVITKVGCSPPKILFGVMAVTALVSMWISNTAATSMMVPIVDAILIQLDAQGICEKYEPLTAENPNEVTRRPSKTTTCFFISTAYASSLGGLATLVGTGTNLVFRGIYEEIFKDTISFVQWMAFATPLSAICLLLIWVTLQVQFMGLFRSKNTTFNAQMKQSAQKAIYQKYTDLGPWTCHQISVAILFVLALLLWTFREPPLIPGWPKLFTNLKVKDSTVAFIIGLFLFLLPTEWTFLKYFSDDESAKAAKPTTPLLTWKVAQQKMPWGLMFLLGGGFALSRGCKETGLNTFIRDGLSGLNVMSPLYVMLIFSLVANILTEFTSNMTLASILLPILAEIAKVLKVHPLFLMTPAAISCSMAFMMPAGTPPNAVAAGYINIRMGDLIKAGIAASIVTYLVTSVWFVTAGLYILNIPNSVLYLL